MNKNRYSIFAMVFTATIVTMLVVVNIVTNDFTVDAQSPNLDASNIYETQTISLGTNIKNLVILLPNEAHESPALPEEQRLINQPYAPQNAVINTGTAVVWFNGDVDHDHKITLVNGQDSNIGTSNVVFESGDFPYNTATRSMTFNDTGIFSYFEKDVNADDPNFVVNGTIKVVNQPKSVTTTTTNDTSGPSTTTIDTIGTLMVPTMDLATHTSDLENRGFSVLSTHNFKDLRGGQSGTGDEQTLIVWGTSISGTSMDDIISQLSQISSGLPYS
jgi:hypothetical protein